MLLLSLFLVWCLLYSLTFICPQAETNNKAQKTKSNNKRLVAHFIYGLWDKKPLPESYRNNIQLWSDQGWEVKVWNKTEVESLLENYPLWQELYHRLVRPIQKADVARYILIYDQGGFYFDCDCVPSSSSSLLDSLTKIASRGTGKNYAVIFFLEKMQTKAWALYTAQHFPIRAGHPENQMRIANYAFGSFEREHLVLASIMQTVLERCARHGGLLDDYGILYTTGPDAVTDTLLPQFVETTKQTRDKRFPSVQQTLKCGIQIFTSQQYLIHLETGTWRQGQA